MEAKCATKTCAARRSERGRRDECDPRGGPINEFQFGANSVTGCGTVPYYVKLYVYCYVFVVVYITPRNFISGLLDLTGLTRKANVAFGRCS